MNTQFALQYRPASFEDMIGQSLTATVLQRLVNLEYVPHALLFSGPSGTGKTTAARITAAEMNPSQRDAVLDGTSVDVIEIDSATNGGVGEIRKIIDSLRYQGTPGANRVVIMDECHNITREGFNALLKPTEEGSGTTFIFVTTEPERIPPTVLSRVTQFEFYRVTPKEIASRLAHIAIAEKIEIDRELIVRLATTAQGNVRTAVTALNLVVWSNIRTVEEYDALRGERDFAPGLLEALLTGDHGKIFSTLDEILGHVSNPFQVSTQLVHLFRDLLIIRSKGVLPLSGPALTARTELALTIEPERILAITKLLWDLKTRVRGSQEGVADLESALILISELLLRGRTPSSAPPAPPPASEAPKPADDSQPRRLSLADLQTRR